MGYFSQIVTNVRQNTSLEAVSAAAASPEKSIEPSNPEVADVPAIDLSDDMPDSARAGQSESEKRRVHEAAEARRKAEFDARQAEREAAEREQLARLTTMTDDQAAADAVQRVGADTEKLTRRNMKEAVCEHIQELCRKDPAFARLTLYPRKTMIRCFKFINRKAREYAEQEMKDSGIERSGVYGCDVPDGLCYFWAEEYFRDANAKEDHEDDEKFIPKPFIGKTGSAKAKTGSKAKSKSEPKKKEKPNDDMNQLSLLEVS